MCIPTYIQTLYTYIGNLHSILSVCKSPKHNLRQAALLLIDLEDSGYDLEIYSNDIIMQSFTDSVELREIFEKMISMTNRLIKLQSSQPSNGKYSIL